MMNLLKRLPPSGNCARVGDKLRKSFALDQIQIGICLLHKRLGPFSNNPLTFHDMYITSWSEVAELLNVLAGSRPMNLQIVDMRGIAASEDFARIVRREVTAAVVF